MCHPFPKAPRRCHPEPMTRISAMQRKARAARDLPSPAMRRAIREDAGITQDDIAGTFSPPIARQTVSRWETGNRRPRGDHLVQYSELLRHLQRRAR